MFQPAATVLAASGFAFLIALTTPLDAQQRFPDFPELPGIQIQDLGMGAIADLRITSSSNRSMSMTVENGVKKISAMEDGLKAYIETDPNGRVLIKVTRQYTSADLDALMEDAPELYMHLKSIPRQSDGADVEVSVGVTKQYTADSVDELEKNHPEAFEVYQRFTSGSPDDLQRLRDLPGIRAPHFEFDPGDIRIHPQPNSKTDSKTDSDSDRKTDSDFDRQSSSSSSVDKDT